MVISICAIRALGMSSRSHGLLIRSLELDNSFSWIAIRSLELEIRSLGLYNSTIYLCYFLKIMSLQGFRTYAIPVVCGYGKRAD